MPQRRHMHKTESVWLCMRMHPGAGGLLRSHLREFSFNRVAFAQLCLLSGRDSLLLRRSTAQATLHRPKSKHLHRLQHRKHQQSVSRFVCSDRQLVLSNNSWRILRLESSQIAVSRARLESCLVWQRPGAWSRAWLVEWPRFNERHLGRWPRTQQHVALGVQQHKHCWFYIGAELGA